MLEIGEPCYGYVGLGRDKVCVILYIYPAECGPKAHGSSGRLFYISVSCPQTGLAGRNSRAPQPPEEKNKGKTRETAPGRFRTKRKGNKGRVKESHNLSGARLSLLILTVLPLSLLRGYSLHSRARAPWSTLPSRGTCLGGDSCHVGEGHLVVGRGAQGLMDGEGLRVEDLLVGAKVVAASGPPLPLLGSPLAPGSSRRTPLLPFR